MQLALELANNSIYSKIDGLDAKEALELTSCKANPLICKNFTFKSLDKTGFTGVMANNSMSPVINEGDIFTGSFFYKSRRFYRRQVLRGLFKGQLFNLRCRQKSI